MSRGFTLIELLISAAIITIISGIVLVRFTSFDGTVLLKSRAYDFALALREAQVYSLSAIKAQSGGGSGYSFKFPYGIHIDIANPAQYIFFVYKTANNFTNSTFYPRYGDGGDGVSEDIINTFTFGGTTQVSSMCVSTDGSSCVAASKLNISFRRPEYTALMYATDGSGNPINTAGNSIVYARITLRSTRDPANAWIVEVKYLGQIIVKPAP